MNKWAAEFKRGRESVEDNGRSGRPKDATADENVKDVHILVMCDRRRDLRSISFGAVQSIPPDILGMSKVLERWVSQMLTNHQKRTQHDISRYVVSRYEDNPSDLIELVVIQYVTWIHHFDPESKLQSKQWKHPGSPPPKKSKLVHSAGKLMTSIFWDSQGVIMIDYPEQGRTINGAYYAGKLRRLRQDFA